MILCLSLLTTPIWRPVEINDDPNIYLGHGHWSHGSDDDVTSHSDTDEYTDDDYDGPALVDSSDSD